MSTLGNLFALAAGIGGGALVWHLTRPNEPVRMRAPCALKLDAGGLTADGESVDIVTAVGRCKASGRAELVVAGNAPAGTLAQLTTALRSAGVSFTQRVA